jgi:hypothetical protein
MARPAGLEPATPGLEGEILERYIKVKAVSGRWDSRAWGLTRTEFERAFRDVYTSARRVRQEGLRFIG